MVDNSKRQAGEIKVTDEMVEAGVGAFYECDWEHDDPREIVTHV